MIAVLQSPRRIHADGLYVRIVIQRNANILPVWRENERRDLPAPHLRHAARNVAAHIVECVRLALPLDGEVRDGDDRQPQPFGVMRVGQHGA